MGLGPGFVDSEGVYQFGEDDVETLMSDLLNLLSDSVSQQLALIRAGLADTGWITPSLAAGWANAGGNFVPLRYRRRAGVVEMQGAVAGASNADPLFTFPAGFRPAVPAGKELVFRVNSSNSSTATTRVVVRGNGTVNVYGGSTPVFDQVRFLVV